jgi:hypothetical protein
MQPPPIQLRPPGLLSLLGIQNGGQLPAFLSGSVDASFELSDWYLRAKWEQLVAQNIAMPNGAAAFSAFSSYIVPAGEWWYVERFTGVAACVAGDSLNSWALAASTPGAAGSEFVVSAPGNAVTATNTQWLAADRPFWIPTGWGLGIQKGLSVVAGASAFNIRALIARVQI